MPRLLYTSRRIWLESSLESTTFPAGKVLLTRIFLFPQLEDLRMSSSTKIMKFHFFERVPLPGIEPGSLALKSDALPIELLGCC